MLINGLKLLPLALLAGCMTPAQQAAAAEMVGNVAPKVADIAVDALGGNYVGALWGAGTLIAGLMGYKGSKWLKGRMTASEPGKVI